MPEAEAVEKQEEEEDYSPGDTKIKKVTSKGFKSFQQKTAVPFYEGLTAIVGENGNGKCVAGDTKVTLSDGSRVEIKELVENALENERKEVEDGYVSMEGNNEKVISLNPDTLETEERNILAYAKREAPEKTVKITTRSGREIEATEDHPLFRLVDGEVVAADAEELEEGERIAAPRETPVENCGDKLTELLDLIEPEDKLYVPYEEEFEEKLREVKDQEEKTWKELSNDIGVSYNTIKGIRDRQSCEFSKLVRILRYCGLEDEKITEKVEYVEAKNYSKKCKMPWNSSRKLGRLLGYLLAEGRVTETNQVWFTNSKEEIVENYESLFTDLFEVNTSRKDYDENTWDVLAYSKPAITVLEKLGVSSEGSGGKKIPSPVLKKFSDEALSGLLEGLYAGDGYVSWNAIELTTKSKELAKDLQAVLLRFGISSRIQNKEKTATNTNSTGSYYQINITGAENVRKFHENVSIPHQMKDERIEKLTERDSNTNIDLIEANGLVQKAVEKVNIAPSSRKNRDEIPKLGAYYRENSLCSREGLLEVSNKLSESGQTEELERLEKLAKSSIYWDEIESIEVSEAEEDWVYDLNVAVNHNFVAENTFVHNSNIIDAISFVFGRRSSKLRAEKLEQLIFNGGDSRKPADYAQVTITLDNSSGIFDEFLEDEEELDEVKVGRKVTRAGSSMYKFMGTNCKRSKIDEIAKKANIDPEGYHFVRQGKVTEIVEQSDTERRKVIDELSGVAEFDEKKEAALEELEEVEHKLQEQELLLEEKEERVDELKEEKELATKYRELEKRKKKLEASILEVRKRALSNQLANLNTDVSDKKDRLEELKEKLEEIDEQIDEKQDRIEEIEDKQDEGSDIAHLENKIEKKKGEIENKRDKLEDLEETIEELEKMQSRSNTGSKAVNAVLQLDDDRVIGAVQDLLSVEDKFAVAIETAAGSRMNNVVVENSSAATDAINYLKRQNIGRATMLPMDKIDQKSKSAKSKMAKKKKGVIDYASNLINYNDDYQKAMDYVFSDTLVAEDLNAVKDIDGVRVVTLDGDIMSRGGAMTGGKKKKKRGNSKKLSSSLDPEEKKKEKEKVEEKIEDLQKDIAELKRMRKDREAEEETDEDLKQEKQSLRDKLKDMRSERQELYSEKEKLKTKIDNEKGKKPKLKAELSNVEEDMEEYDFDTEELKTDSSPEDLKKQKKKLLRKQNSMGPVNMRAIEEYKQKKEELEEFKEKISEIRQEKLEIEDMIEEIDQRKRERFMDTLEEIQSSFSDIFTQLFEGGNGELVLEDDDIEKGLKIRAQPPGKEPHIIDALSGGEKTMTAIAFVFAILEYEESPFYLMDEIDAALDKTNSKLLSELLKDYAEDNQFIVISHNDITVRHAERAYGISMRDGVSKVRSIELDA